MTTVIYSFIYYYYYNNNYHNEIFPESNPRCDQCTRHVSYQVLQYRQVSYQAHLSRQVSYYVSTTVSYRACAWKWFEEQCTTR